MKEGICIDNGLHLLLNLIKSYQALKKIVGRQCRATPFAESGYRAVLFMTMLTFHSISYVALTFVSYSISDSNCCITFVGFTPRSGVLKSMSLGLNTTISSTNSNGIRHQKA